MSEYIGPDDITYYGRCSHCERTVDNYDPMHRVISILEGGRGVECVYRGDILPSQAQPLGWPTETGRRRLD